MIVVVMLHGVTFFQLLKALSNVADIVVEDSCSHSGPRGCQKPKKEEYISS